MVPWNAYALRKVWNNEIKVWAAPWWAENSKEAYASGVAALASALDNFSKSRRGVLRGRPVGFPRHKRKTSRRSFTVSTGCFGVADARHVRLPVIGVVRTKEPTVKLAALLDAGGARVLAATVSETAGRWFVSLRVEMASPAAKHRPDPRRVAGVDLGVKTLATVVTLTEHADGTTTETVEAVPNPKPLGRWQRKLARQARQMARRQPGSRRRARTAASLARTHHKVANARRDSLHKLTSRLATTAGTVVVEDLNVAGRVKNRHLARAISDAGFSEVRRQLTYKTAWAGGTLVVADRYYPSSKSCSACGTVKAKLSLAERTYTCEHCRLVADRNINAARNLAQLYPCGKREAQASHATSTRVAASGAETSRKAGAALAAPSPGQQNARGGAGSGRAATRRTNTVKPAPANREAGRPRQGRRTGTAASAAAA